MEILKSDLEKSRIKNEFESVKNNFTLPVTIILINFK